VGSAETARPLADLQTLAVVAAVEVEVEAGSISLSATC
jgi:hypothetical protein